MKAWPFCITALLLFSLSQCACRDFAPMSLVGPDSISVVRDSLSWTACKEDCPDA